MARRTDRALSPLLLLGDSVTLTLLLAGGLITFLRTYGVETDFWALGAASAVLAVLAAGVWQLRQGVWIALGGLGIWGLAAWFRREKIVTVLAYIIHLIRDQAEMVDPAEDLLYQQAAEALPPVLIWFFALGLALLLGWLVVRARCWYLPALAVWAPLMPACLRGTLPSWWALLAATTGWGTLLLTALFSPRDRDSLGRATLLSQGALAALLAALTFALPMEGYDRPQWATNARDRMYEIVERGMAQVPGEDGKGEDPFSQWMDRLGFSGSGSGEVTGEVDLRTVGPRRYTGRTVLTVSTNDPAPAGRIYLRGTAMGAYTGESWEAVDEESAFSDAAVWQDAMYLPARTAGDQPAYTMAVRHAGTGGTGAYYPYRLSDLLTEGLSLRGGGRVERSADLREYQVSYCPGGPEDGFQPGGGWEYRAFVYDQYLQAPESTRQRLAGLLGELGREAADWPEEFPEGHQAALFAARRTAKLISSLAAYDLDTPAMEEGEDFVDHFLEEGRGYCVHFATLGTLLLRMEGVPARYVAGYVAALDGSGQAAVRDSAAHAWVEIYLDGYGWYPVEMTPGYEGMEAGAGETTAQPPEDSEGPDVAADPDAPGEAQDPEVQEPAAPEKPDTPEAVPPALPGREETPTPRKEWDLTWLWRTVGVLLCLAIPAALYRLAVLWRRRRREDGDTNRSAIAAYCRYRRLLAWGRGEDGEMEALARRAKFSQHTLTEEERAAAWDRLETLRRETEKALPVWKRWCLRALRPVF